MGRSMPHAPTRRRRPDFAELYGIHEAPEGMLDWAWAVQRLAASRNYWIATADADGRPRAAPVWGVWFDDAVVFGSHPRSRKGRNLVRDPRVVVHLESGDEVVILEGEAEPAEATEEIATAFEEKYDWKPEVGEREGWFRVHPKAAYAWLERDYPRTATRFDF
jgi:nitroimidazol reductase NimA-like FMN-containing flavoprotein (pyridoxamine 5'-phosphate oxidase superfamily)